MPVPPQPYKEIQKKVSDACLHLKEGKLINKSYFEFIIEKDGSIDSVTKFKANTNMTAYDGCIVNELKKQERWQPGFQNSKPVRVLTVAPF